MTTPHGLFLVLDGPDGGGKSTQVRRLVERIRAPGREVETVRDPGGTPVGERIRGVLLDPEVGELDPVTEVLLYQAARRRLVLERIRPALEPGRVVVCDRWHTATQAYQGGGSGVDAAVIRLTTKIATDGLEPRRAILLDVDEATAAARMTRAARPHRAARRRVSRARPHRVPAAVLARPRPLRAHRRVGVRGRRRRGGLGGGP